MQDEPTLPPVHMAFSFLRYCYRRNFSIPAYILVGNIATRKEARANKNWAESDRIRDELAAMNIVIKDSKEGTTWSVKE